MLLNILEYIRCLARIFTIYYEIIRMSLSIIPVLYLSNPYQSVLLGLLCAVIESALSNEK